MSKILFIASAKSASVVMPTGYRSKILAVLPETTSM